MRDGGFDGRRVVVTGGAGFIGSHLAEELIRQGARVTVIDNFVNGRLLNLAAVADEVDVRQIDLRDRSLELVLAEREPEVIFHLAGYTSVPDSVRDARADFEQNAAATFELLETVRRLPSGPRIVFASSAAVYGEGSDAPLREADPTAPVAPYGVSKLAAERYMDVYARVYGLRTASLRLFHVYGPRLRRQVVWDLMSKVHENRQELMLQGDGTQIRDFMYVANTVEAMILVAKRAPMEGEVYNASDEQPTSIRELAERICQRMGVVPRISYSGGVRPGVSQRWVADATRLKALGFQSRATFGEGLDETVAWFLREGSRLTDTGSRP